MRLYSIQPRWVWDQIQEQGQYQPQPQLNAQTFVGDADSHIGKLAYDWLCDQMESRGLLRPVDHAYPVWAWYHCYNGSRPKPDLRTTMFKHWANSERAVLMTLEVPDAEVLVFDYHTWHYALNYWYFGSARETALFARKVSAQGYSWYRHKPLPEPALDKELRESWSRIFDLARARRIAGFAKADQPVQATFWTLQREQVLAGVEFGAQKPLKKLPL